MTNANSQANGPRRVSANLPLESSFIAGNFWKVRVCWKFVFAGPGKNGHRCPNFTGICLPRFLKNRYSTNRMGVTTRIRDEMLGPKHRKAGSVLAPKLRGHMNARGRRGGFFPSPKVG